MKLQEINYGIQALVGQYFGRVLLTENHILPKLYTCIMATNTLVIWYIQWLQLLITLVINNLLINVYNYSIYWII